MKYNYNRIIKNTFTSSAALTVIGIYLLLSFQNDNDTVNTTTDNHYEPFSSPSISRLLDSDQGYNTSIDTFSYSSSLLQQQSSLPCLAHSPIIIHHNTTTTKPGSDPNKTILEHQIPIKCGKLKRQWLYNPPISEYAKLIDQHQTDCTLPVATHHFDNTFGLGSHLILWGQAMCNGIEDRHRMISYSPNEWLWLDQEHCDATTSMVSSSPLLCYFPSSENRCSTPHDNDNNIESIYNKNITDPRNVKEWCKIVQSSPEMKTKVRASSTEYLFHRISPLVIQEAQRQIGIIFPNDDTNGGHVPDDLVTVHIRWGDKFWEMDLPSIQEYIDAVNMILSPDHSPNVTVPTANIYLATEDPRAYEEFMNAKPNGWTVFADITLHEIDAFRPRKGNRASWAARNTKGRAGLIALGSLLVAMEANKFVLTTKSNWSTLMDHLRTQIIDPRCDNCTEMIDLRPGIY